MDCPKLLKVGGRLLFRSRSHLAMTSLALSLQAQALRLQTSLGRRPPSAPASGRPSQPTCSLSSSHWMRGSGLQQRWQGPQSAPRARGALRVQALFEKFTVRVGGRWAGGAPCSARLNRGGGGRRRCPLTPARATSPAPAAPDGRLQERSIKSVMLAQEEARRMSANEVRGWGDTRAALNAPALQRTVNPHEP